MSITVNPVVTQDYIPEIESYILKDFPIRADYRDGMWTLGNLDPHLKFLDTNLAFLNIGQDLDNNLIRIGMDGLYEIAKIPSGNFSGKDIEFYLLTSDNFLEIFHPVSMSLPHTDEIYDSHTKILNPKNHQYLFTSAMYLSKFWNKISQKIETKAKLIVSKIGFIYVVELDGYIKVGFSKKVNQRLKSYKTSSVKVNLIYKTRATIQDEKAFHRIYNKSIEKYQKGTENKIINNLKLHMSQINN